MDANKMKKILLLSLTLTFAPFLHGQELPSLQKIVNERNMNDPSEFAYVGNRCTALFSMVAGTFRENGTQKDVALITQLENKADDIRKVALTLDINANKKSQQAILAQHKTLNDAYIKQLIKNKQLHNNYFEGSIATELQICNSLYPTFHELSKKIPN